MSAIITEKFRQHNARNFYESFSEASADVYYLFLGKATPFTTGTTGGSDSSPSTPADSVSREFYNWDSMLGAKKVTSSDIAYALPRRNWTNTTVYDMYKDEQIKNCYEHFKKYFKTAGLLNSENIRGHAINLANENDKDPNNYYLEFGVFTGSTFNYAMKVNKRIEKLGYKNMDCEFIGFDSFKGFGHIKKDDEHPNYKDNVFWGK